MFCWFVFAGLPQSTWRSCFSRWLGNVCGSNRSQSCDQIHFGQPWGSTKAGRILSWAICPPPLNSFQSHFLLSSHTLSFPFSSYPSIGLCLLLFLPLSVTPSLFVFYFSPCTLSLNPIGISAQFYRLHFLLPFHYLFYLSALLLSLLLLYYTLILPNSFLTLLLLLPKRRYVINSWTNKTKQS